MPERILVVDDERPMALAMQQVLERKGFSVDTARNGAEALDALAHRPYDIVFTDLRMPSMDGGELLERMRSLHPSTQVVVVTAFGTVESAVSCVRGGALDYLTKPFSPEALVRAATQALRASAAHGGAPDADGLVAQDPTILAALALARRAAPTEVTVLLEAESGAGKEVFARLIHRESRRRQGPFVAVNCAALPRVLLEAELFGHVRGAFTGAHRDRRGHFQAADGGTLFLDEIGEMHPELQARLLRVLQDRLVQPIGADQSHKVDVRVIAATNRNLGEQVANGAFREDLYYRLRVLPLRIPPLRERPLDIEPLARTFGRRFGGPDTMFTPAALARLQAHDWPGNVRELENAIQRAVILAGNAAVDERHLTLDPVPRFDTRAPAAAASLEDAERETIFRALTQSRGNRGAAAEALGISPRTLRHKLQRYRAEGHAVPVRA